MNRLVSVIVPTKNRLNTLSRAIDSILQQEQVKTEIIVVNDGSTDDTESFILNSFPQVKLINNPISVGGAKARNIGAECATGNYVAFLDSDDEWLPNHLSKKLQFLDLHEADGVYSSFYLKDDRKLKLIKFYNTFPDEYGIADKISDFHRHDARSSTFVFKREAFLKIKFDEKLMKHQDWDLAINFENTFKFIYNNSPTVVLHVDSFHPRMSNVLKHESTLYFLNKNKNSFKPVSIFYFCVKMVMRCQSLDENDAIIHYLQVMAVQLPHLTLKEKILYSIMSKNLLNLNTLRLLRRQIIKWTES